MSFGVALKIGHERELLANKHIQDRLHPEGCDVMAPQWICGRRARTRVAAVRKKYGRASFRLSGFPEGQGMPGRCFGRRPDRPESCQLTTLSRAEWNLFEVWLSRGTPPD